MKGCKTSIVFPPNTKPIVKCQLKSFDGWAENEWEKDPHCININSDSVFRPSNGPMMEYE